MRDIDEFIAVLDSLNLEMISSLRELDSHRPDDGYLVITDYDRIFTPKSFYWGNTLWSCRRGHVHPLVKEFVCSEGRSPEFTKEGRFDPLSEQHKILDVLSHVRWAGLINLNTFNILWELSRRCLTLRPGCLTPCLTPWRSIGVGDLETSTPKLWLQTAVFVAQRSFYNPRRRLLRMIRAGKSPELSPSVKHEINKVVLAEKGVRSRLTPLQRSGIVQYFQNIRDNHLG